MSYFLINGKEADNDILEGYSEKRSCEPYPSIEMCSKWCQKYNKNEVKISFYKYCVSNKRDLWFVFCKDVGCGQSTFSLGASTKKTFKL